MSVWRSSAGIFGAALTAGTVGYLFGQRSDLFGRTFVSLQIAEAASGKDAVTPKELQEFSTPFIKDEPVAVVPSRISEIMRFGYPGFDNLRTYEDFVVSYDRRFRTAHWVMEHLTPDRMVYHPSVDRSKCRFRLDESLHPYFRSTNLDYMGSGYDRGHLAAAGNHRKSQTSIDQTFLLSNIAPQVGKGFNRDKWNHLERYVRELAKRSRNVYVCTGPLYLPKKAADGKLCINIPVIGDQHVAVATHFFKVALVENNDNKWFLEAYVLPNCFIDDSVPLKTFLTPLETIERAAGFLIFQNMPKNMLSVNGN